MVDFPSLTSASSCLFQSRILLLVNKDHDKILHLMYTGNEAAVISKHTSRQLVKWTFFVFHFRHRIKLVQLVLLGSRASEHYGLVL